MTASDTSSLGWHSSPLVYGAWRLEDDPEGASAQHVARKIETCLEVGITTFDHADIYGGYACEAAFGAALATQPGLRTRLQLVSKCDIKLVSPARPEHTIKHYDTSAAHISASVTNSLRALRTDWLDLLLLHRPDPLMDPDEICAAFVQLQAAGKVRYFGVSNFTPAQFEMLQSRLPMPLVTNQIELSLLHMAPLHDGTLDHCLQRRIRPMAWSPLGGGALFSAESEQARRVQRVLGQIAAELNTTPDQVALAWLLAHPAKVVPVVGTHSLTRIQSAARAVGVRLTRPMWFALWTASAGRDVP